MLSHEVTGTGAPLLLLHAGVADRRMWDGVREPLSDTHTVVTPDLRGFGQSPLGSDPYSHVADVLAVLDHLGIGRASVVGASFGGLVAMQFATAHPDRVDRLVLAAPPLPGWDWSESMRTFWAEEDAGLERGDVDAAVETNVRMWAGADPTVQSAVRAMQWRAFELQLGSTAEERDEALEPAGITAPTLIVVGSRDLPDFAAIADRLVRTMPQANRAIIEDAGHLVAIERPAEFTALVTGFLQP